MGQLVDTQTKNEEFTLRQQQQLLDELTDDLAQLQEDEREELVVVDQHKRLKRSAAVADDTNSEGGGKRRCFGLILKTQQKPQQHEKILVSDGIVKIETNTGTAATTEIEQYFVHTAEHNGMIEQDQQQHQTYDAANHYGVTRSRTRQHREQQRSLQSHRHPKLEFIAVHNAEVVADTENIGGSDEGNSNDDDNKHGLLQSFILKNDNAGNMLIANCDNQLIQLDDEHNDHDHYDEDRDNNQSASTKSTKNDDESNIVDIIDSNGMVIGSNCSRDNNTGSDHRTTSLIDINHLQLTTQNVAAYIDNVAGDDDDVVDNDESNDVAVVVLQQQHQALDGCLQDVANAFLQHDTLEFAEPQQYQQCNNRCSNANVVNKNNNNNLNSNNLNMVLHKQQYAANYKQQTTPDQETAKLQETAAAAATTASAICVNNLVECVEYFEHEDDDLEDLKVMIVC